MADRISPADSLSLALAFFAALLMILCLCDAEALRIMSEIDAGVLGLS